MSNGRNKYQSRENRERIRGVLMQHWAPIGISDIPDAHDEYDNYVGKIYVMLIDDRASRDDIEQCLYETATGYTGLPPYGGLAEKCATTAAVLVGLRPPEFETH
jgi:hypothetical protein